MSDSVRPHRRQPIGLRCPWDSPGKNTGVGCHFLLQCVKVKSESEVIQSCPTLIDPMDCSVPGSSVHGIFQARVLEWGAIAFSRRSSLGADIPKSGTSRACSCHGQILVFQFLNSSQLVPFSVCVAQTVKRLSTMRETRVRSLGREDPLEKEMAIHSSTIAWKIPWTEETGRLQSMGSQRIRHD